jgi:catechol 2,3-dioxygenase-like lactoylglutathione lyase family enzyme
MSAIKTTGLDHVVLHVSDLQRSITFYRDVLGMSIHRERETQAFMKSGENLVGLFLPRDGETSVAGGIEVNHLALRLESGAYDDVKAKLEAAGCQVHGRPGDDHCIYFADPDGHSLQAVLPGEH